MNKVNNNYSTDIVNDGDEITGIDVKAWSSPNKIREENKELRKSLIAADKAARTFGKPTEKKIRFTGDNLRVTVEFPEIKTFSFLNLWIKYNIAKEWFLGKMKQEAKDSRKEFLTKKKKVITSSDVQF